MDNLYDEFTGLEDAKDDVKNWSTSVKLDFDQDPKEKDTFEFLQMDDDSKNLSNSMRLDSKPQKKRPGTLKRMLTRKKKDKEGSAAKIEVFEEEPEQVGETNKNKADKLFESIISSSLIEMDDDEKEVDDADSKGKNAKKEDTKDDEKEEEAKKVEEKIVFTEHIQIGKKQFGYSAKDPIFKLTEAVDPKVD